MSGITAGLPRLVGDNFLAYVRFLMEWTDAAPMTGAGQVHHHLVTLTGGSGGDGKNSKREGEKTLLVETFKMERLRAMVELISEGIACGATSRPACSEVVRNAMTHAMTDRCAGSADNHGATSTWAMTTAEKLLSATRSTQYRGSFVVLLFHSNEAVRLWARGTLLRLVNLASSSATVLSSPSLGDDGAASGVWLLGMQLLCTVGHITRIPLKAEKEEESEKGLLADGICSLLAVLTALDARLAELERSLLQNVAAAGQKSPSLFGGVSTATVLLLGGSMLLGWILSAAPADGVKGTPSMTQELTTALNARLGVDTTLQSAALAKDTRRALVKTLVHCLFNTAKRSMTLPDVEIIQHQRRMRDLWCVASHIDPPPPTKTTTSKPTTVANSRPTAVSFAPPAKSAGWLLRFLMHNASVQLNMPRAVREAASSGTDNEAMLRTMETAVHVIGGMLTSLAEALPGLVSTEYYHQFLMSVQKDCIVLAVAVVLRTQHPQAALGLLRHFMLTDLMIFASCQSPSPAECLLDVWEAFPKLLQQVVFREIDKVDASPSPSLPQQVVEVLAAVMAHPSVCVWLLLKPLKDGPQPLGSVVAKCIGRVTEVLQTFMEEMGGQLGLVMGHRGKENNLNTANDVRDRSSEAALQLFSSGSPIPCITYALILSYDPLTQRLGTVLSALFLSSFAPVVHDTFRADAANWLLQVILHDPVLQKNVLKLHDAKVDAVARTEGAVWVTIMCACNWSNLPDDVLAASWWLCALLVDVCVLEKAVCDRLLEHVVTQLPSLAGGAATTSERAASLSTSSSAPRSFFVAPVLEESTCFSSQRLLCQCAQHLLLMLVQKYFLCSPTIFARAVLHVAGALPPPTTKLPSDQSFMSSLSRAFEGALQKLPEETRGMLTDYATAWLAELLRSARRRIDDGAAEQNRRLLRHESEERRLRQLEEMDERRAAQEEAMCRANMERRRQELEDERGKASSVSSVARTNVGVKRPRDEMPSLMIAQQPVDILAPASRRPGVSSSSLLPPSAPPAPPPTTTTTMQRRLQELGERRVNEFVQAENVTKAVEAIRRVAGNTAVQHAVPRTDDIVGHGRHCLASDVPVIPQRFPAATNGGYDLYVRSFLLHIALELRYELHQKFDEMINLAGRSRDSACRRDTNRPRTFSELRTHVTDRCGNMFLQPSGWVLNNAVSVVCAGDAALDPLDSTCLSFNVALKITSETATTSFLSAALSENDVAVLLMPLAHVATSLPSLFRDVDGGLPDAWQALGCVPQLCLVTSLPSGHRTAKLTVFTSSTASASSRADNDDNGVVSLNFAHVLRAFTSSQTHFFVKRLSPLGPSLASVGAIYNIRNKAFAGALLEPHLAAKTSRMFHHAVKRELLSGDRWPLLSRCLLAHNYLNEWQMQAIVTVLAAAAPGWEVAGLQSPLPVSLLPMSPDFFIIEGPPGTGKTQTIAALTLNLLHHLPKRARRVLLCAPSNCAVDEVLLRVRSLLKDVPQLEGLQLLRVGVRENVGREVLDASPPLFLDDCVGVLSNNFNTSRVLATPGRVLCNGNGDGTINGTRQQLRDQLICASHVVCCTLGSLSQVQRVESLFDIVIVDEASQGTEPDVAQALMLAKRRAVLVGDAKQLQPTVLCPISAARGLKRSLLQRLLNQGYKSSLLRTQYRMHPDICSFPNRYFYNDALITHTSVMTRRCGVSSLALPLPAAMEKMPRFLFVDVPEGRMEFGRGRSLVNRREAAAVVTQMRHFRVMLQLTPEVFARHAGIITFYQAQREAILRLLSPEERRSELQVATVDSFQGKEKNIVFISCVRAPHVASRHDGAQTLGFLEDWHRINVSLTRAREFCLVFGHGQTFHGAAWVAAKKKQEQGSLLPPLLSCADNSEEGNVDDDVICEEGPPAEKSDDDPFVLHQLLQHVMHLSGREPREDLLDTKGSAAMFTNSINLHLPKKLLLGL